jgi:hypothetical protein
MKKALLMFVAVVALLIPTASFAADKTDLDGYWWEKLDTSFKLGWVSGYAKAMDLAGTALRLLERSVEVFFLNASFIDSGVG